MSLWGRKDPLQEALLIKAHSRIVQLESELSRLRQDAVAGELKHGFTFTSRDSIGTGVMRQNQLEEERSALVEEVAALKIKLTDAEALQQESNMKLQTLTDQHQQETQALKGEVERLLVQNCQLDALNDEMQLELNEAHIVAPQQQLDQVDELKENYSKSVEKLKSRIAELETIESRLLSSQSEVRHLQHRLRLYRQDANFLEGVQDKLLDYESLQHEVRLLREENRSLTQDRTNADLLRYQSQSLQERCAELEGMAEEAARLRVENEELSLRRAEKGNGTSPVLQVQLAELQQREVVAFSKCGQLTTQLKLCEDKLLQTSEQLQEAKKTIELEKAAVAVAEEKMQKLERRLIFVTKERDGCINVLSSYKQDSGVDGMLRELLVEKEQALERAKMRISKLESELVAKERCQT